MPYNLTIPGWMPEAELRILESLAKEIPKNGKMVEVGPFCGRSSWCWSKSADPSISISCIDIWDPGEHPFHPPSQIQSVNSDIETQHSEDFGCAESVERTLGTIENFLFYVKDCHNIKAIRGRSPDDFLDWPMHSLDLIFLDGIHHNPYFFNDVIHWWDRLKPGGIFCGDDCARSHPDVLWTIDDFSKKLGIRYMVERRIWMIQKPK